MDLCVVRLTGLDLNNIKAALAQRATLLKHSLGGEAPIVKDEEPNPYGENVRIAKSLRQRQIILTPAEKDEVVVKYQSGMTMSAIARIYGCHHTTIGKILRKRGVEIRG